MSNKQLLIEAAEFTTPIKIEKGLKESISVESNKDVLIVRNIPATIADRKNQNGRIYTTEVLQEAIDKANFQLKTKWMYSQADEHPEGSFVAPTHASHVVINAYIKKNVKVFVEGKTEKHNVMFMDWEILNTEEGKNLKALILQETACPTSIRGLGDMNGDYVVDYELLGCDVVSNPSSGTSMRMPVTESIKVEKADKSYLDEAFEVTTVSNDTVADVEAAAQKQVDIEQSHYGTITNIKTKLDQEIDPKTQATTTITSIEATTTDEVSDLNQALQMAKNAFVNPVSKMDSVTISFVDDNEDKESIDGREEPSLKEDDGLELNSSDMPQNGEEVTSSETPKPVETPEVSAEEPQVQEPVEASEPQKSNIIVDGLKNALKNLNDMIANTDDQDTLKQLQMNRNEIENLIQKNINLINKASEKQAEQEPKEDNNLVEGEVAGSDAVTTDDNKVYTKINDDITLEKDFDDHVAANVAAKGVVDGQLPPETLIPESSNEMDEVLFNKEDEPSDPAKTTAMKEEEPTEEPLNNSYNIYAFLNGQLVDDGNSESEEEAIEIAKQKTTEYENQGANFNVIVVKVDGNGFEDFDKLIYQYPKVEVESTLDEYVISDTDSGEDDIENRIVQDTEIENPAEIVKEGIHLDYDLVKKLYDISLNLGLEELAELSYTYLNGSVNNSFDILNYIEKYLADPSSPLTQEFIKEAGLEFISELLNVEIDPTASTIIHDEMIKNPELDKYYSEGLLSFGDIILKIINDLEKEYPNNI